MQGRVDHDAEEDEDVELARLDYVLAPDSHDRDLVINFYLEPLID